MKILVVLQSSVEPLYQTCTQILKDTYKEVCVKKKLPVDVISYVGDAEETHFDGDTLYIACDNKLSIDKHRELYKYIYEHPEYDVIIKTNVSTVLNLELLCKFISSQYFFQDGFYSCVGGTYKDFHGDFDYQGKNINYIGCFPIGFFYMAPYKIWKDIYKAYDEVVNNVKMNFENQYTSNEKNAFVLRKKKNQNYIFDVHDDIMLEPLLRTIGIQCIYGLNYIKLSDDESDFNVQNLNHFFNESSIYSSVCVRCKLSLSSQDMMKIRNIYEPKILHIFTKIYKDHNITINDEKDFMYNIRTYYYTNKKDKN